MDDQEEIEDDETIYRKISVKSDWYDSERRVVKQKSFKPFPRDTTGLSVSRAQSEKNTHFQSLAEAAVGPSSEGYYVACLRVGNLRSSGIQVVPKPISDNPGHAEISDLTYENRKSERSRSLMVLLAHKLVESVEGPFLSEDSS